MSQTVIGVFASNSQAQQAVTALKSAGYSDAHIDVSSRDNYSDTATLTKRNETVGGFFSSLFGDDDDTRNYYTESARRGTVVTVHTDTMPNAERAADILDEYGAIDGEQAYTKLSERNVDFANDHDTTLEVIKEDLAVGKREVQTGGVRVRSRIVAKPVSESIRLREEEVFVTRTPVNRPATDANLDTFKEGTITMTETAEVPVVEKSARVVEEISIGKQATERVETITETVRETEVDVERVAGNMTNAAATAATGAMATAGNALSSAGNAVESAGNSLHNALDRDNDGEIVDLDDNDGRIG